MNRRHFIQGTGLGLAVLSLPGWLQACSGGSGVGTGDEGPLEGKPKSGAEAFALAKRNGRPLLVFVVPSDTRLRWERGSDIGVYLNRVDDEGMADLSLCGLWCATLAEIRSDFARAVNIDDATIAILIETERGDSALVSGEQSPDEISLSERVEDYGLAGKAKARTEMLRSRLHALIAPDKDTLHRRAEQARAKFLPRADRYRLGAMNDGDLPTAAHVKRVPAWVRWRAEDLGQEQRAGLISMLAVEACRRWRSEPPPRSRWGKSTGCGIEYEDTWFTWKTAQCGAGYTPAYSARFLSFFSERG